MYVQSWTVRDLRENKVKRVQRDQQGPRGQLGMTVPKVLQDPKEHKEKPELLDRKAPPDRKGRKVSKDRLVRMQICRI